MNPHLSGMWFREPALKLYGTTRIAQPQRDQLRLARADGRTPAFVHVMFREWCYRIPVANAAGERVHVADIEHHLWGLVHDVNAREEHGERAVPIGRLTADHRDQWAKV